MSISIKRDRLAEVLERAVILAESDAKLPQIWLDRVERIAQCPSKTYVAALGTALLAKAADPRVDTLSVKSKAGPNAYSMRGVVKLLVEKSPVYGYHLGRTGPEPLNNQPFFGTDRIDRFENVKRDALPFHRDLVRYLTELNQATADQAAEGLAAFLRLRIAYGEEERAAARGIVAAQSTDIAALIETLTLFLREDPEGGRRGQALVAAAFDLVHEEVDLAAVNDPRRTDVSVSVEGHPVLAVEVKQKAIEEAAVLHVAEEASERGADKALLVALAPDQRPLDRERVRRQALERYGVLAAVWEGVAELVTETALQSPASAVDYARDLPRRYLKRMQEHGVSQAGQQYWADLTQRLAAAGARP